MVLVPVGVDQLSGSMELALFELPGVVVPVPVLQFPLPVPFAVTELSLVHHILSGVRVGAFDDLSSRKRSFQNHVFWKSQFTLAFVELVLELPLINRAVPLVVENALDELAPLEAALALEPAVPEDLPHAVLEGAPAVLVGEDLALVVGVRVVVYFG